MAWETRQRGTRYYTKTRRENGRQIREYIGSGELAQYAAAIDQERQSLRDWSWRDWRTQREGLDRREQLLALLDDACAERASSDLQSWGYHYHRGEWRKSMTPETQRAAEEHAMDDRTTTASTNAQALMDRAQRGDREALDALLSQNPEIRHALREQLGDLARFTQEALITSSVGRNEAIKQGIREAAEEKRRELEGPVPSALERLLVDRTICCWIDVNAAEQAAAQNRCRDDTADSRTAFNQRWCDRSHRRFLSSCKVLAQVQKLTKKRSRRF